MKLLFQYLLCVSQFFYLAASVAQPLQNELNIASSLYSKANEQVASNSVDLQTIGDFSRVQSKWLSIHPDLISTLSELTITQALACDDTASRLSLTQQILIVRQVNCLWRQKRVAYQPFSSDI